MSIAIGIVLMADGVLWGYLFFVLLGAQISLKYGKTISGAVAVQF